MGRPVVPRHFHECCHRRPVMIAPAMLLLALEVGHRVQSKRGLNMHTSMCTNIIWCRYLTLVDLETEGLKCMPFCCITRALFSQVLKLEIYALTCVLYPCLSRGQKWLANSARKGSIRVSKAKVEISGMQFLSPTCQSLFPVSIISPGTPLNGKVLLGIQRACLRARFRTGCEH